MLWLKRALRFGQNSSHRLAPRYTLPSNVDSVERTLVGGRTFDSYQEILRWSASFRRAHPLTTVLAATDTRNLVVGLAQDRVKLARVYLHLMWHREGFLLLFRSETEYIPHHALGLPGLDISQLFRESALVCRRREGLSAQDGRGLMVSMAVARRPRKSQNNDIRTKFSYHPYNIRQHFLPSPFGQGFIGGFGVTEVDRPAKELLGAIYMARSE